ncbi:MAG: aminotransferase class V-fold PLP-dependent enzyme, partial [Ruthenibacterium sp.]
KTEKFETFHDKNFTALLVNACETSTAQAYDLDYLSDFCKRNKMLLIVDAVSAYLTDQIDMEKQNIDVLLTASQKALALAPGVALVAISERVYQDRILREKPVFYFDFANYIENQKRGQPPFTSAVGTMLALHQRLRHIVEIGVDKEIEIHANRAQYFREKIKKLPVSVPTYKMSNSCTAVIFDDIDASEIYRNLKEKYGIILTPSGGILQSKQLRVGHLGNLELEDYDDLIEKLEKELMK